MNVIVLWLNDNDIYWDVGLVYERENYDYRRFYDYKISKFLYVSYQNTHQTLDMVV